MKTFELVVDMSSNETEVTRNVLGELANFNKDSKKAFKRFGQLCTRMNRRSGVVKNN